MDVLIEEIEEMADFTEEKEEVKNVNENKENIDIFNNNIFNSSKPKRNKSNFSYKLPSLNVKLRQG